MKMKKKKSIRRKNIEFKAYFPGITKARSICQSIAAELLCQHEQKDTYFMVSKGELKLRQNREGDVFLIHYSREDSPTLKESSFEIVSISKNKASLLYKILKDSLGILTVVEKHREVYKFEMAIINIDKVKEVGNFIEVEVEVNHSNSNKKAFQLAERLKDAFEVTSADIIPWSNLEMKLMYAASEYWHRILNKAKKKGRLFLIDGPSGAGKTLITKYLQENPGLELEFVPRYCTRTPREEEKTGSEYFFVSQSEFRKHINSGSFIEYRDYKFGMSYGFPWKPAIKLLIKGKNVCGLINLGNGRHIKKVFPEAVTILICASEESLRRRLIKRGIHNEAQIEERLQNSRTVNDYKQYYDYVIANNDGNLEQTKNNIKLILKGEMK